MIYLIGGPPRTGKTTLAKKLSKRLGISWLSTDTLEVVSRAYVNKSEWEKKYPYTFMRRNHGNRNNDYFYREYSAEKIISALKKQAKTAVPAIDNFIANEIANGNDFILEGYHLDPALVNKLVRKFGKKNFKVVFLTKLDSQKFAEDVYKSTTPNDWLLVLTKKAETFVKVGHMVAKYGDYFEKEAKRFKFRIINTDSNFKKQLQAAVNYLA